MTELRDEGLMTDDPVVAAMFIGEFVVWRGKQIALAAMFPEFVLHEQITIPYSTVWVAIQPVEGEAVFFWRLFSHDREYPAYSVKYANIDLGQFRYIKSCPITNGKSVGELRDLVRRCKEAL